MSSLKPKKPETFAPVFETSDTLWYGLANIALKIKMNEYRSSLFSRQHAYNWHK